MQASSDVISYRILASEELDRDRWNDLLINSTGGTIYHTAEWASLWPASFPCFQAAFAVADDGWRYVAGLPLVIRGRFPLRRIYSMPMGGYGGLLLRSDIKLRAGDCFGRMREAVCRLQPCLWEIVDFEGRMGYLVGYGFQRRRAATHVLDLKEQESRSRQKTKRGAVQSAKRGVEIKEIEDEDHLKACYCLLQQRDRAYGQNTKYPYEFFRNIWKELAAKGYARIALAISQERIIGFSIDLFHDDTAVYWDGASHPEFRSLRPADALIQAAITWALKRGGRWLNLGGSPPEAQGLVRFKENWGGRMREYDVYRRQSVWFNLLRRLKP